MRTILMIQGGKVSDTMPSNRFKLRLSWAIDYYQQYHLSEDIVFLVTGRYSSATAEYLHTESEIGKRYILDQLPNARIVKEDISLETIGNFAFSKPIIVSLKPDNVIILNSDVMQMRTEYIAKKLFANDFKYAFHFIEDELSADQALKDREDDALQLAESILEQVSDGDDSKARDVLLYRTPYYFKGIIDDKTFFDQHWPRGFEDFIAKRSVRYSKG